MAYREDGIPEFFAIRGRQRTNEARVTSPDVSYHVEYL
jgi:hypothetical protein